MELATILPSLAVILVIRSATCTLLTVTHIENIFLFSFEHQDNCLVFESFFNLTKGNSVTKILALSGSTRNDSFNKKILKHAITGAEVAGATVTNIDLRDFPLDLYDGDIEAGQGLPEKAKKLKKIFSQHDALLFALPEYNSSLSGVFKNTIDWLSRSSSSTPDLSCFSGKVCALISASPGKLGGMRGLVHARSMLESINVMVMPEQICVGDALEAIGIDGVKDDKIRTSLEKLGLSLTRLTQRISFRATQHI